MKLDGEHLRRIQEEVMDSFSDDEIKAFTSFEDFFAEVDVQNAYEEGWEESKESNKPYYESVFQFLKIVTE